MCYRILKEERNYILQMVKKIRASGCNVLLIQKSILRDAVTDLSLHYLVSILPCDTARDNFFRDRLRTTRFVEKEGLPFASHHQLLSAIFQDMLVMALSTD